MKVLTWNLKIWPALDGLPTEGEKADADSQAVTTADIQGADPIDRKWEKGKLVDFARVDKLIDIIAGLPDSKFPDVIFFQEVVSKRFVDYAVSKINAKKGSIVFKNVAHYNEPDIPQGLSVISKYDIIASTKIDIHKYLADHAKPSTDSGELKDATSLNSFISATSKPEFNLSIGGDAAWGKILSYATGSLPTLRPILAVQMLVDGLPLWCINVHLKSHLPPWSLLGLNKPTNPDTQTLSIGYAINKAIREIYAYSIAGFVEYQTVAFPTSKASFLVCGDFNTSKAYGADKPETINEATLNILTGAGFTRVAGGSYKSFNDFQESANSVDIDHVFWKAMPGGLLEGKTEKAFSLIDMLDGNNAVRYGTVSTDSTDTYLPGNYYVVPKSLSKKPEDNLYLSKTTNSFLAEESGFLKEGVTIYVDQRSYYIQPQKKRDDRKAVVLNPGTTKKILVELPGTCAIKETTENGKEGTIASFLGVGKHLVEIKAGSFEGGSVKKPGTPKFDSDQWEPVYKQWSSARKSYYKGVKITYQGAVYACKVPHDTVNQEIGDPAYLKKYWTKLSALDSGTVSDHNGLLVEIG